MVLLPKFSDTKPKTKDANGNVFFENDAMDQLARHFIGNNHRLVLI